MEHGEQSQNEELYKIIDNLQIKTQTVVSAQIWLRCGTREQWVCCAIARATVNTGKHLERCDEGKSV